MAKSNPSKQDITAVCDAHLKAEFVDMDVDATMATMTSEPYLIAAPMILDSAMDGDMFIAYVSQVLLKELRCGDVVVMDNLPAHKVAGVRAIIEGIGAKLMYLPRYSPDFNPIEKAFSQIKAFLKKMAARTKEKLDAAIAAAIDVVSAQNAINYFAACGYESDTV